ncbi:MAG: hypothetical protein AAGB93_10610 [Planctomycetota bacterium]
MLPPNPTRSVLRSALGGLLSTPLLLGALLVASAEAAPQRPNLRTLLLGGGAARGVTGPWELRLSDDSTAFLELISVPPVSSPPVSSPPVSAPPFGVPPIAFPTITPGFGGSALILRLIVPATGELELFTLFVPDTPIGVERPLLTCFHGANVSHLDIFFNTSFLQEAEARDWFLIAPFQRGVQGYEQLNYACVPSQLHVQAVIDFVLRIYDVDRDRLYGVGFSMGGGSALSFAARHRDRSTGAFAAAVNHTGTVSLGNVYANQPNQQMALEAIFGGTPTSVPFAYQRSSVLEVDPAGALVSGGRHMARNLEHVPIRTVYGVTDTLTHLIDQSLALDAYMQLLPQASHELFASAVPGSCNSQQHCWATLDETATCDFLAQHSLVSNPPSGGYLIDRDDVRWGRFRFDMTVDGEFASMKYDSSVSNNQLQIDQTRNIDTVGVDVLDFGLDPTAPLQVWAGAADGTGDVVVLEGFASQPVQVTRNGSAPIPESCNFPGTVSWCYANGVLTLHEVSGGGLWSIQ